MTAIKTVMVAVPPLLRDLIQCLAEGRVELDLIAELDHGGALLSQLQHIQPGLVVVGPHRQGSDEDIAAILAQFPATRVIRFSAGLREISGYCLQRHQVTLTDASPQSLLELLRALGPSDSI
jgi:hypothetical protein